MKFKIGDKVKVVSLMNTENAFNLDENGFMRAALYNIYEIENIDVRHDNDRVYLSFRDKYDYSYIWHENDLQLVNSKELEIE